VSTVAVAFFVRSGGPAWLDEQLTVGKGSCRYDVRAASAPAWWSRAGIFEAKLDGAVIADLEAIARRIVDLDPPAPAIEGHLTARVTLDGHEVTADLGTPSPTRPLNNAEEAARQAVRDLLARCRDGGTTALELDLSTVGGTSGPGGPATARLHFANIGVEPVTFRLGTATVRPGTAGGSAPGGDLLLLDADGGYLGGGILPATLPVGGTGFAALVDAIDGGEGAADVGVVVEGTMTRADGEVRFRVEARAGAR